MIAPLSDKTTLEKAVDDYARSATKPFNTNAALPTILGRLTHPPSEPWLAIDCALDDCDWLLLDGEHDLYVPRHVFFANAQFLIVPQPAELEEGILIPGHRFLPFLPREGHPAECRLTLPDGNVVPTRTTRKPMTDLLLYLAFFGSRGAVEYVAADANRDGNALDAGPEANQPLTITVFDMAAVYEQYNVKPNDVFLCTVTDYAQGHYTLSHIPADKRRKTPAVRKWVANMEDALYMVNPILEPNDDIHDQLAKAFFFGNPALLQNPPVHLGGFLSITKEFVIQESHFGTLLRAEDDGLGDMFEGMMDRAEAGAMPTGRCDSLEAILSETGLTVTVDEIAAYMHDEISRGGDSVDNVMARVLEGRYGLDFYDERQMDAYHQHLEALWNRVKRDFDPAHDKKIGPLRARILAILDRQVAWLRECDALKILPTDLPHDESVALATLGGILSQTLKLLQRDTDAPLDEIRKLEDTIGMVEQDSEQILARLRAATNAAPSAPPQLDLWRPDAPPATPEIYQLRIDIKDIRPPIWRRVLVMNTTTLAELHTIIQNAFDWDNAHLHEFEINSLSYGPMDDEDPWDLGGPDASTDIPLHAVIGREGSTFKYTYDFGDDWKHAIKLEKVLPVENGTPYPRCIKGKRACPPEDCGGPWGYEGLLEALSNPTHPSHTDLTEWLGDAFNPEAFDLTTINKRLARLPFGTERQT